MKVLVCTQMFPEDPDSAVISGMIKNPYYQTVAVSKAGVDVEVITTGLKKWKKTISNINVHSVGDAPLKGVLRAFIYEMKMSVACIKTISRFEPELIHIHHLNLPLISMLKRLGFIKQKLIYTAHGTSTPELKAAVQGSWLKYNLLRINGHVQHWLDIFCWHQADYLLSPSAIKLVRWKSCMLLIGTRLKWFTMAMMQMNIIHRRLLENSTDRSSMWNPVINWLCLLGEQQRKKD